MRRIVILTLMFISGLAYSQIAIGRDNISSKSVSLEFGEGNRGLILPWVTSENAVENAVQGTLIFDTTDKKVKVKKEDGWKDLTVSTSGQVDTSLQSNLKEYSDAGVMIGSTVSNSNAKGILVLSDKDKAMVLPKVANPHRNIVQPAAGMIVYDTVQKQLAVFNGKEWTFWEPSA